MRSTAVSVTNPATDILMEDVSSKPSILSLDKKAPAVDKDDDLLQFAKAITSGIKTSHTNQQKSVEFANSNTTDQGAFNLSNEDVNANHFNYSTPQQVPGSIFTTAHKEKLEKAYDLNKISRLFIASNLQSTLDQRCFCTIRGGFAFCINHNCNLSHGGSQLVISPSQAYIKRSPKQAFIEPSVNISRFGFHLSDSWMNMANTLSEWVDRFQLAESAMRHIEEGEITEQYLHNEKNARSKTLTFKSSKKRKPSTVSSINTIEFSFVKTEETQSLNNDKLKLIIKNIEDALQNLSVFVRCFHDEHLSLSINTNISLLSNEEKLTNLHQVVGKKSSSMVSDFDAPTIWSTIALIGSKLCSLSNDMDSKVTESVKRLKPNNDLNTLQVVEPHLKQLDDRIDLLKNPL